MPPLDSRLNLTDYVKKIEENSITFEAWNGDLLIGLIAVYFNDHESLKGFITSVSVAKNYTGNGIASTLLINCIKYAETHGFKSIFLEVNKNNIAAIKLYNKYNFIKIEEKDDFNVMTKFL